MHRRPLASFSILSQIYGPQHHNPQNHKPKPPAAIAKPEVIAIPAVAAVVAALPPLEKKKSKLQLQKKLLHLRLLLRPPCLLYPHHLLRLRLLRPCLLEQKKSKSQ